MRVQTEKITIELNAAMRRQHKFQAQAYCSLNFFLNFIFLGSFLLAT